MRPARNILIIDDDQADRFVYRHNLSKDIKFDWHISEAATGKEGYQKVRSENIDCILLDYNLPDENGLTVLTHLKDITPYTPVILITGQGDEKIAVESMRLDAQDYIGKDRVTSQALHRAVHNAMINMEFRREVDEQQTELENFARILAHDLREPARSISYLMHMIEQEVGDRTGDKLANYLSIAQRTSNRMLDLINSLASYTQLDRDAPKFEPLDMNEILDSAKEGIDVLISEKNARIISDVLPTITGDSPQLVQLIQNLICNGIKYCEQETPVIHVSADMEDDNWIFSVSDNGIGIPSNQLIKIFDPFKRLHSDNKYSGTGLGLATCKKIVDRHGGKIWCESEVGRGSIFYFTINSDEED